MSVKRELSSARFIPYILIAVNFVGWEIIKRTSIFTSPTISQQALRLHGAIAGSMLLIFTSILFARFCLKGSGTFQLYNFEKYLFILLIVDLMAFMVGLAHQNAIIFLIGDTYKFAVMPLAYFCTAQTLKLKDAQKLFVFIIILETVVTLESFIFYIARLAMGIYERSPQHSISLLALIFFLIILTSKKRLLLKKRFVYWILLLIIGITSMLSQARTLWVQIILCPFILLLIERKRLVAKSISKLAIYALILLIPLLLSFSNITHELGQRVTGTFALIRAAREISPILSADRRVSETKSTLNKFAESPNILNFLVGFGNGAEFYAPTSALGMGSKPGYKHHIHNGYLSLFFRMGLVGLSAFLIFSFSTLKSIYLISKHGNGKPPPEHMQISNVMFVYLAVTLVEFLTIYSFIGDIKWGVLLGLFRTIRTANENSN